MEEKDKKIRTAEKLSVKKETVNVIITVFAATLFSVALWTFVYPAKFAPSAMSGIYTMLYETTGFNAGYSSLIFNTPLIIGAWFLLKRRYVVYTILFTVLLSVMLIVLEEVNFYQYDAGNALLSAIFSGVIVGFATGLMIKIGASTGGSDIIAGFINVKRPYINVERGIAIIGYTIALSSYFVYKDLTCILLSIVQMFVLEKVTSGMLKDRRNAIEVKIITGNPYELKEEITLKLRHGATVIETRGMYTDKPSYMVVSVINTKQISELEGLVKKYPNTFVYYSEVLGVKGNFRWRKDDAVK